MKDGTNTSRSQEINVHSFTEELSSSDRTGRLVETEVNQTRSSEDCKSLNVEQSPDRTGRLVIDTAAAQDDSQVYHEADTLNVDDEVLRERIEKSTVHDENHEPMMVNEADMDFKIPGLPHSFEARAKYQRSTVDSENWEPPRLTCSSTSVIRDETFRNRMIENGRDEDVCRQWDALADEDYTHHLTPQEFSFQEWLVAYFKQDRFQYCASGAQTWLETSFVYFAAIETKKKDLDKRPRTLAEINNGHRVLLLLHGGVGKVHGGLLIPMKVTMEMNQVLIEHGDLLYKYLEHFFKAWCSWIHLFCNRWIVYSWLRSTVTDGVCVNTIPQMTYFLGAKRVKNNYW